MQWAFTAEQLEFRAVLRRYFQDHCPPAEARRLMQTEAGWDKAFWRALNDDLGLGGVHIPEAFGGQGFGLVELGIVLEEMGRALVCAPYFSSSVLAATAISNIGTEADKAELLPGLCLGETTAALAITEPDGLWEPDAVKTAATRAGAGWRLSGVKSFVVDGRTADLILVVARDGTELGLFAVDAGAAGLERRALTVLDPTRKLARLDFAGVEARRIGEGDITAALTRTLQIAAVALSHEMVGGAEKLRESALGFAKLRVQFGQPIAAFQSMKHKQADMLVDVELAKTAAYVAAASGDDAAADFAAPEFAALAHMAKAAACEAYLQTAIHTIQIHGGVGFTWENDTHLWFKRAKSSEVFLGDGAWNREQMMRAWGH